MLNRFADAHRLEAVEPREPDQKEAFLKGVVALKELCQILGLFRKGPEVAGKPGDTLTGPLLDLMVELRSRLRKEKNFALADEIRKRLGELGVTLEDRPDGTGWKVEAR